MVFHPEYREDYKEQMLILSKAFQAKQAAKKAEVDRKIAKYAIPGVTPKKHIYMITADETKKAPTQCPCTSPYCREDKFIFYCECPECGCMEVYLIPGHCIHCQINCDEKNSTF